MNLLLFEPEELTGELLQLPVGDRRAQHISRVLELGPGAELRVGMVNGDMGTGRILNCRDGSCTLEVQLGTQPPAVPGIELILALPRPIMLQRILKQATVLGVRRFHLIRSRRVHKSFFQASILQPSAVRNILLQGLEQAVDTRLPEVSVYKRFKPFIEDVLPGIPHGCRLIAHPGAEATLADLHGAGRIESGSVLAVGPEGGWIDYELQCFSEQGFVPFAMGGRILHVDTAVVVLLSQLQILQELSMKG